MQTVDKAMRLLGFFSSAEPEIGLSEMARLAGFDKAATRRFLVALSRHGMIEQNAANKRYRLGSAFLRFARIREATMPFSSVVQPFVERLAEDLGETAHASLFNNEGMSTVGIAAPQRATRVYVDPAQPLPLHATASGLVCLAFSSPETVEATIGAGRLHRHTAKTTTSAHQLRELLAETRRRGYGVGERSFEDEVIGMAAAIFDWAMKPVGAIAVASIASRFTKDAERQIAKTLLAASIEITRAMGGQAALEVVAALKRTKK